MKQFFILCTWLLATLIPLIQVSQTQGADSKPAIISINEFVQLDTVEQKKLLLKMFQKRLDHSKNLFYDVEITSSIFYNEKPGELKELKKKTPFRRYQEWKLNDSYRMDTDMYRSDGTTLSERIVDGYDAKEGVSRGTITYLNNKEYNSARIDTIHDPIVGDNRYIFWLSGEYPHKELYLFQYLINHKDEFEIEAPVKGDKVQLTVGYQPHWTTKFGGKRVFILDPEKGCLPIEGTSRWNETSENNGKKYWRVEKFVVTESELVGGVWMPVKIREIIDASSIPDTAAVYDIEVKRIEHGTVSSSDLNVRFPEGYTVVDAIKGVSYTTDATGNPAGPVELVMGGPPVVNSSKPVQNEVNPIWRYIVVLNVVMLACFISFLFYKRHKRRESVH
ncbi:hypothetical protein [Gimesia sp.]|uniref:hypothetical protein n=1 Tax=Gimesia sp. TaxID=2024833 RepID=UPI003A8F18E1